eukprot:tig00000219_g19521.t1
MMLCISYLPSCARRRNFGCALDDRFASCDGRGWTKSGQDAPSEPRTPQRPLPAACVRASLPGDRQAWKVKDRIEALKTTAPRGRFLVDDRKKQTPLSRAALSCAIGRRGEIHAQDSRI